MTAVRLTVHRRRSDRSGPRTLNHRLPTFPFSGQDRGVAKDQTPNRDGEERTRVFDAPEATRPLIPQPPPLPPKRPGTADGPGEGGLGRTGARRTLPIAGPRSSPASWPAGRPARSGDPHPVRPAAGRPAAGRMPIATIDLAATLPELAEVAPDLSAADIEMLTPVRPAGPPGRSPTPRASCAGSARAPRPPAASWAGSAASSATASAATPRPAAPGSPGCPSLIELHAVNTAGDLLITLALAQSVFFGVQPGQARGKVALYLVITMVPFVLLAPVIGPLLDRFGHGRRHGHGGDHGRAPGAGADHGPHREQRREPGAVPGRVRLPGGVQGLRRDPQRGDPAAGPARAAR